MSENDSRDAEGEEERSSARARAGALGKGRRRIGDEEREKRDSKGRRASRGHCWHYKPSARAS